jgi:hypothetical protein
MATMPVDEQDWATLEDASRQTKVPLTTIRDWYRGGAIDASYAPEGHRLVRLSQVEQRATGMPRETGKVPSARLSRPPADHGPDVETATTINRSVRELQGLARERLEPQGAR